MLRRLSIRNIVLIDVLDLDFGEGLGAMTGETGAGKSILLDALGAALGARATAELVRYGSDSASVTAEFDLPPKHPALAWLKEQGLEGEDNTLLVRRVVASTGRSRAFINDQAASVTALKTLGALLVEIHGQFDDRALIDPAGHRALLDAYAGLSADVTAVRSAHSDWRSAENALEEARAEVAEAERDAEYVRHSVAELEKLAPEEGEEAILDTERRNMQRSASIAGDVTRVISEIGAEGAEGAVSGAIRRLEEAATKADGQLDVPLQALARAMDALSDAIAAVDSAAERLNFDPHRLEQVEERLFALRDLARKHRVGVEQLAGLRASLAEKLGFIDAGAERIKTLEVESRTARDAYLAKAEKLSQARVAAAGRLDKAVIKELAPLKLDRAVFTTRIESDAEKPAAHGIDAISFEVTTNPGSAPGPIDKIASGGELSRFLLALKVCLARESDGKTLIFDEIDRGVGGATAAAIGARLRRLGEAGQTLVITHAPQVAANATQHWRIQKSVQQSDDGETTTTKVTILNEAERIDEIARMLAGETITDEARQAAQSLMKAG